MTDSEKSRIFKNFLKDNHRVLFMICRYTAERIGAVIQLTPSDCYDTKGNVRSHITFRGRTRKQAGGKRASTRQVHIHTALREVLAAYYPQVKGKKWMFPSRVDKEKHISHQAADEALRHCCDRAGLGDRGISTHSFRRTAITELGQAGIGARVIQSFTGHKKLEQLVSYIEVSDEEVKGAVELL